MEDMFLVLIPLGALVIVPFIHNKRRPVYWGAALGTLLIAVVVTAVSLQEPRTGRVNNPMTFAILLAVVPTAACFTVCRLPILRNRRLLLAAVAPITFLSSALVGLSLSYHWGFIQE